MGSALPWWILSITGASAGFSITADVSVYLYQATFSVPTLGLSQAQGGEWYTYTALALLLAGSIIALVSSVLTLKRRILLSIGGILALAAVVVFPVMFQMNMAQAVSSAGASEVLPSGLNVGLFSSGSFNTEGIPVNYVCYLTFGFWLSLIAAVLILVGATRRNPASEPVPQDVTAQPPPPPTQ